MYNQELELRISKKKIDTNLSAASEVKSGDVIGAESNMGPGNRVLLDGLSKVRATVQWQSTSVQWRSGV
jgi:hypothetical protein